MRSPNNWQDASWARWPQASITTQRRRSRLRVGHSPTETRLTDFPKCPISRLPETSSAARLLSPGGRVRLVSSFFERFSHGQTVQGVRQRKVAQSVALDVKTG